MVQVPSANRRSIFVLGIALQLSSAFFAWGMDMDIPSLFPEHDEVEIVDADFVRGCRVSIAPILAGLGAVVRTSHLSSSSVWGLIWRADLALQPLTDSTIVQRVVCWRGRDGELTSHIAVGPFPPLSSGARSG
jgi:hypothetical protein